MRYIGNFQYQTEFNGILRHFWNEKQPFYYSYVNVTATGYTFARMPQSVIDFNTNSWWYHKEENTTLTVCLQKHAIKLTSYDIKTSTGSCRLKHWFLILKRNQKSMTVI